MASPRACRALKKNGRPCRAPALRAGSACFWHAAETREAAAEARRLGGLRRRREGTIGGAYALEGFRTGADLQRVLELALADTLDRGTAWRRSRGGAGSPNRPPTAGGGSTADCRSTRRSGSFDAHDHGRDPALIIV